MSCFIKCRAWKLGRAQYSLYPLLISPVSDIISTLRPSEFFSLYRHFLRLFSGTNMSVYEHTAQSPALLQLTHPQTPRPVMSYSIYVQSSDNIPVDQWENSSKSLWPFLFVILRCVEHVSSPITAKQAACMSSVQNIPWQNKWGSPLLCTHGQFWKC